MEAHHHDDDRGLGSEIQLAVLGIGIFTPAKHGSEFVVDDLYYLLPGRNRLQDFRTDRLFGHRIDEAPNYRQCDIGFEQGDANLAHRFAHVVFRQRSAPFQAIEDIT